MPSRREYLAAVGIGALAGCLGGAETPTTDEPPASATPTSSPTASPASTAAPATVGESQAGDGTELTLETVDVQGSLSRVYTDSGDVRGAADGRFVLAELSTPASTTDADAPSAGRYTLVDGDERARPIEPEGSLWLSPDGDRWAYSPGSGPSTGDSPGGWLAFRVDAELDAEAPRLVVGDGAWTLPDHVAERLRQPAARYAVRSFDYPETVGPDEGFTVSVTAENVGPVAGTFRAVLNASIQYASMAYPVRLDLEPGESATWEKEYGPSMGLNEVDQRGRVHLATATGERQGSIEVVAETATPTPQER